MRIVVAGPGLVGSGVVAHLTAAGHEVRAVRRSDGVDAATGTGLEEALRGAEVVVDTLNARVWDDDGLLAFFRDSTRHLLAAGHAAGVRHHVALSVVGADRLIDSGYLRAKRAQEQLVESGPVPFTIVRSTQFLEFVPQIADASEVAGVVRVPPAWVEPVAAADVAARLADLAVGEPVGGAVDVAGPERLALDDLVRRVLAATGDRREVAADERARYFGALLEPTSLVPATSAGVRRTPTTLAEWIAAATSGRAAPPVGSGHEQLSDRSA